MKKIFLTLIVVCFAVTAFSQIKVGLRLAPGLGLTSVEDKISNAEFYTKGNASFAFTVGPDIDFFLTDNIAFCTGIWWSTRKVSVKSQNILFTTSYQSSLQYLQFPITFKAYTNEINNGLKVYAQLGGVVEAKISDKLNASSPDLTKVPGYEYEKWYQYANVGLYAGAGVEYSLNESNAFFAGIYYQRGFLNQARNFKNSLGGKTDYAKGAKVTTSSLGLEVGFKF